MGWWERLWKRFWAWLRGKDKAAEAAGVSVAQASALSRTTAALLATGRATAVAKGITVVLGSPAVPARAVTFGGLPVTFAGRTVTHA